MSSSIFLLHAALALSPTFVAGIASIAIFGAGYLLFGLEPTPRRADESMPRVRACAGSGGCSRSRGSRPPQLHRERSMMGRPTVPGDTAVIVPANDGHKEPGDGWYGAHVVVLEVLDADPRGIDHDRLVRLLGPFERRSSSGEVFASISIVARARDANLQPIRQHDQVQP